MMHRKMPGVRQASIKEARELSKLAWVRDDALSDRSTEARVLPDGRVLLYMEGERGVIYPSRDALQEMNRQCAEMMAEDPRTQSGETLLPPVADFLRDVEAHAASLGTQIRAPAEALDRTVMSLAAVDIALRRIPWAKRMTPEIVTPLVAYVGQVMLPVCGGRWTTAPTTRQVSVPIYEPSEMAAWQAVWSTGQQSIAEARQQAAARGASTRVATKAASEAFNAASLNLHAAVPKPIRFDVIEEPISDHENEPMITARDGKLLQPFVLVFVPMVEPSKRLPLRAAVETTLIVNGYRPAPKPAA